MMELEDQLCSLEPSKKLEELGVEQKSLWYWVEFAGGYAEEHSSYKENLKWVLRDQPSSLNFSPRYSAFTVAEGLNSLPQSIDDYHLNIEVALDKQFACNYVTENFDILNKRFFSHNLSNAVAQTRIWLIENKHIKLGGK